ncbi:MFS transporter [Actinomadura xylanilytica]|uniref:MFS transporter n=1 Tax=Actinomadura xylanilytica TaxID=887459 RepID=UPI00255A8574|nr:MFS transporter [Actinomadura xylanilytica]MDL4773085.1 MFS transporter [Actinomadura xylanilytica]
MKGWPAVIAVMLGIFAIVTTEILPIGLLTPIGSSFAISDGTAGLMMAMPGVLAAFAAPAVTVATGRFDRRPMLCALVLLLAVADVLAAVAPAYWMMLVSRVLVGIVIGGFWSIGAGLAGRLVPPGSTGRATAVIFSAVPLGSVLGVPAGTFIGGAAGWRTAFAVMAALTAGVLVALIALLPPLPAERVTRPGVLGGLLRAAGIRSGLLVTFLVVLAHFGAYTYVAPFLERVTRLGPESVTACLLLYGAAGIAGTFIAGSMAERRPRATFGVAAGMLAAATLLFPVLGTAEIGAIALLAVWGIAYGAVPVCSKTWFAKSAPDAPEAASVIFTASFQATFSAGALAGGAVVDRASLSTVMVLGGVTALVAAAVMGWSGRSAR